MYTPKNSGLAHLALKHPIIMVAVISMAVFMNFRKEPQPVITISFDNGYESTYTKALPILKRYGLPAAAFITTDNVGEKDYMGLKQLKILKEAGWEIGLHNTPKLHLASIPKTNIYTELYSSKQTLQEWGFPANSFAVAHEGIACEETDKRLWKNIKDIYKVSRGCELGLNKRPFPQHDLKSIVLTNDTKIEEIKRWIDKCIEEKAWLILTFHRIGENNYHFNSSEEFLEEICKYIKDRGIIEVSPLSYAKQNR